MKIVSKEAHAPREGIPENIEIVPNGGVVPSDNQCREEGRKLAGLLTARLPKETLKELCRWLVIDEWEKEPMVG